MLASLLAIPVVVSTTGTSVPPVPLESPGSASAPVGGVRDVLDVMWDNINANGYQTAAAMLVATIAIIAMRNTGVHVLVMVPVAVGAFWAGWLGWNTVSGQDHALFPGDVDETKLWDVASTGDGGFLLVLAVACVATIFLWRRSTHLLARVMLLAGAVLGSSFVFNLVEAVRDS